MTQTQQQRKAEAIMRAYILRDGSCPFSLETIMKGVRISERYVNAMEAQENERVGS